MEILFAYNIVTAVLLFLVALIIFGAGAGLTDAAIRDKRESAEGAIDIDEAAHWRVYRRVTGVLFALAFAWAAWCVHDNYEARAVAKIYETSLVDLGAALDEASKRPFDKRCQFNGQDVSDTWIQSDSFPCADFGGIRLWRNSQIVVSKYNVGEGSKIFVGRREGADMVKIVTYNPESYGSSGLYFDYLPWLITSTDPKVNHDLADTIRKALR